MEIKKNLLIKEKKIIQIKMEKKVKKLIKIIIKKKEMKNRKLQIKKKIMILNQVLQPKALEKAKIQQGMEH